jgi:3-deoxy-7-phosphoheptulonate synthase
MSVLVTGAAGFVGPAAVEHPLARGERVLGLDLAPPPAEALQGGWPGRARRRLAPRGRAAPTSADPMTADLRADPAPPDRTSLTDDARVEQVLLLPPPEHLIRFFPIKATSVETLVATTRERIRAILQGRDDRLLVVVGPCSIHDPGSALEYAQRLAAERARLADRLEIVMRVYFEKPRTTIGWKGLINDPYLDGSFRISEGLRIARQLMIDIARLGVPAGSELLDTVSPQYIGDLVAWGAIGARTTESQVHRELASGASAPIGFKNGTDGNVRVAIDAIQSAMRAHHFLGVHKNGGVAMVRTRGNPDCHAILRGGRTPNYDAASVAAACDALASAGLVASLMVDCSHANSAKRHERQLEVATDLAAQVAGGSRHVFGTMIESHLEEGAQPFVPGRDDPAALRRGRSITDACLGWDDTVVALARLADAVDARRAAG